MSDQSGSTASYIGTLFIISAPSGAGKTSLVNALLAETENINVSISHTTRPMRPGEESGVHYYFVDKQAFSALQASGELLESAQVFDNFYGTSVTAVNDQLYRGTDVILEIDWQGAQQVRVKYPECTSIFILPPSKAALRERLSARGQDDESTISRRMQDAVKEMSHYPEYDYIVVNDDFELAKYELKAIIIAQRLRLSVQSQKSRLLLKNLLE